MTTLISYATEQPYLIVIVATIVYVFFAAGHWSWPMLPDAGLAALYVWRPSIGMLAFVLLLGVVRHTPRLAAELAALFHLTEFDGWTSATIYYLLPALPVKPFAHEVLDVMSRSTIPLNQFSPTDLRTDARTDGRTPPITGKQLFTLYRSMREHGFTRDEAKDALKASGLPFSSDVWTAAEPPPPVPLHTTPIVGRQTNARFDDDFPYEGPPS